MEIISNTTEFYINEPTAVAIGKFDGVHVGHRGLLEEILQKKEEGLLACVFTFDPSPAVFFGKSDKREITDRYEKRRIFEKMGVDVLIEFPLNYETAEISPDNFAIDVLSVKLNAAFVAAGTDLSFGYRGAGNAKLLTKIGQREGFSVKTIEKVKVNGVTASSSHIKELIENGYVKEAEAFLGEPYSFTGSVMHGKALGAKLGYPTINVPIPEGKIIPKNGVYKSRVKIDTFVYDGLTNIGSKPTVSDENVISSETYIINFDGDIYGNEVEIMLSSFIRPEKKFESVSDLVNQIEADLQS